MVASVIPLSPIRSSMPPLDSCLTSSGLFGSSGFSILISFIAISDSFPLVIFIVALNWAHVKRAAHSVCHNYAQVINFFVTNFLIERVCA